MTGRARRPSCVILGGTGMLVATAERCAASGERVLVTARRPDLAPPWWRARGIPVAAIDRDDVEGIEDVLGDGVRLLVDGQCYTPEHAASLARWSHRAASTVMISARAVYVDASGRHQNSDEPPCWDAPTRESTPTMAYAGEDHRSRDGYGASKAEAERVLARDGVRVSVLRPAQVLGPHVRRVREWPLLRAALGGAHEIVVPPVSTAPVSVTSTAAIAAAVTACADAPAARVLNVADSPARPPIELARATLDGAGFPHVRLRTSEPDHAETTVPLPWIGDQVLDSGRLTSLGVDVPDPRNSAADAARWVVSIARREKDGSWSLPTHLDAR